MKKLIQISLWGIAATMLLQFAACQSSADKIRENAAEKALENATGKDVDINKTGDVTIEGNGERVVMNQGENVWPADIPGEVPEFKGPAIQRVTQTDMNDALTWNIIYEGAATSNLQTYNAALKAAGFKTALMQMPQGGTVTGEKGDLLVSLMVSEKTCMVSVQRKK